MHATHLFLSFFLSFFLSIFLSFFRSFFLPLFLSSSLSLPPSLPPSLSLLSHCNRYIFPGIGLGACLSQASKISDRVFYNAAKALSCEVEDADLGQGIIFPNVNTIRDVSLSIARSTVETVVEEGNSRQEKDHETFSSMNGDPEELERWM